jgi:hypothetical protein
MPLIDRQSENVLPFDNQEAVIKIFISTKNEGIPNKCVLQVPV